MADNGNKRERKGRRQLLSQAIRTHKYSFTPLNYSSSLPCNNMRFCFIFILKNKVAKGKREMRKVIRLRSGGLTCSNFIRDNLEMQIHIKLFAWILIYYELEAFHPFSTWCMLCFQQNRKTEREPMRFVWFSIHGTAKSNFFSKQGQRIPQLVNFKTHLKTWWQYFLLHAHSYNLPTLLLKVPLGCTP